MNPRRSVERTEIDPPREVGLVDYKQMRNRFRLCENLAVIVIKRQRAIEHHQRQVRIRERFQCTRDANTLYAILRLAHAGRVCKA